MTLSRHAGTEPAFAIFVKAVSFFRRRALFNVVFAGYEIDANYSLARLF